MTEARTSALNRINELVSVGGVVTRSDLAYGFPPFGGQRTATATTGWAAQALPGVPSDRTVRFSGTGRADDAETARAIAAIESLERYSACAFTDDDFITATAIEVATGEGMDFATVARCSARELAEPGCPLTTPDPDAPQRWVWGVDLATGRPTLVPAVMTFLHLASGPGERYWHQISTGVAARGDLTAALCHGLLEVIERDALAVVWHQQLPLPVLAPEHRTPTAEAIEDELRRRFVDVLLLDATTDLGVPTVYCLQLAPHARRAAQLVSCATGTSLAVAAERALGEAFTIRAPVTRVDPPAVERLTEYTSLTTAAAYMGQPSRREAFDFLSAPPARGCAGDPIPLSDDPAVCLSQMVEHLARLGMHVYAVDLTCDEAAQVGISVARVIVPELQPFSLLPLAQYRGHPRLYAAPARLGYPVRTEEQLNPWPQPFA